MRSKLKLLSLMLCFSVFTVMSMGSGSDVESTKEIVDSAVSDGESKEVADEVEEGEENSQSTDISIDEMVLVDQDGLKITATEYVTDGIMGDGINLLVENNSDTDYTVGCDALIVNDFMIADLFATEIAAGKKANEVMYLSSSELSAAGINNVGKVEMYFHAYDDNWDNLFENVYSEIKTSKFDQMDATVDDSGTELYNEDGIRIIGKTVDENSFWGSAVLLYCENTSGKNVGINVDDMSINGFMMSPVFSTTIYDNKKVVDDITIFSSDLEDNGIDSIDDVELKFHIYNADTYDTIKDTDPITFSAK